MHFGALRLWFLRLIVGFSIFGFMPSGFAQNVPQPPVGVQGQLGEKELRAFAKAYVETHKLREKYTAKLQSAGGPDQQEQIRRQAAAEIENVLTSQGLTVKSYNHIFTTVNEDEILRKKALSLIKEERARS